MNDGDILQPRPAKNNEEVVEDVDLIRDDTDKDATLVGSCLGAIDLKKLRFLSHSDKKRFYLSSRAQVPQEVTRGTLEKFFDDFDEDVVAVLSVMGKCFVARIIERTRIRQMKRSIPTSNGLLRSDLLDANSPERSTGL